MRLYDNPLYDRYGGSSMKHTLLLALLLTACGNNEEETPAAATCEEGFGVAVGEGGCAGVSAATLCADDFCVPDDAKCARVVYVDEGASLPDALAQAESGECIALAAGSYTGGRAAGGVSIFGAGAAVVSIAGGGEDATLTISGGDGGRIRGVTVSGSTVGLRIEDTRDIAIEQVLNF